MTMKRNPFKRNHVVLAGLTVLCAVSFTGCGSTMSADQKMNDMGNMSNNMNKMSMNLTDHQHMVASGDIQEDTPGLTSLPVFLQHQDPKIVKAYQVAAKNLDLLKQLPCYCGCGESAGHTSNASCFVKSVNSDGTVVWDDHGTKCDTCMDIAITSAKLKEQGKSVKEIRTIIDNKYKEGYAKPTPTPMPQ